MKKEILKKIIIEFKEKKIDLKKRFCNNYLDIDKTVTIIGARRVGKTYFLYQIIDELLKNNVSIDAILYINFEDERISFFETEDFELLLDSFFELNTDYEKTDKFYLFFDEIQLIDNWEKFIRRLSEDKKYKIYITGSSSKLLSTEIASSLRGRTLSNYIYPFSFKEFLKYHNYRLNKNDLLSSKRYKLNNYFEEYFKWGGYPETFSVNEDYKLKILQEYYDLIFYKDLLERFDLRNFYLMKVLMKNLINNFAAEFSLNKQYNDIKSQGIKISKETILNYFSYLCDIHYIYPVSLFSFSINQQNLNPKKVYIVDAGLITANSFLFSENKGRYLENLVAIELFRRYGMNIYYHKNKYKCDFLVLKERQIFIAVQICYELTNQNQIREINGLIEVAEKFGVKKLLLITRNQEDIKQIKNLKIEIVKIEKWLLT
ncbi:MAG TPA: ATP-binding protein [bacterium]|nr:ATP-binding protein [bacterium]